MKSTAKKAGRVDERAARPDDAAAEGVAPEAPEEQTMTFPAIADTGTEAPTPPPAEAEPGSHSVAESDDAAGKVTPPAAEESPGVEAPQSLADVPEHPAARVGDDAPAQEPAALAEDDLTPPETDLAALWRQQAAQGEGGTQAEEAAPAGDAVPAGAVQAEETAKAGDAVQAEEAVQAGEERPAEEQGATESGGEAEPSPPPARTREVPLPQPVSRALSAALAGLKNSVTGLRLGLEVPGVAEARKAQAEILAQLENYVIPRVHMSTAPALIAVVGSTGAGKSTLVNTLAAAKVSLTGVRRPTTGTPVLVCHPDDRDWFTKGDVLGDMVRVDRPTGDGSLDTLVLTDSERLPTGVALLDTPDIDSVVERHHDIARRMLDASDLWIFVTTATRYADAPAWELLRLAKERGTRIAIVLSRVPQKSTEVIEKHFARMLQEYGLGDVERFVVEESTVTAGRLPDADVAELRMWLTDLSVDDQRREQAVRATLDGVLNSFRARVPALARHLEAQVAFRAELRTDVDAAYMGALAWIDEATGDGSLLRGEVLARWQDFAGSGDLMKTIHVRRPGRLASKAGQQAPARLRAFKTALRAGLESVIVSAAQRAAEEVVTRWRQRDGVGDRLAAAPGLGRPSEELVRRAGRMVGAWQEHVVALIRSGGMAKRSVAKVVAFDEEALALVFMVGLLGYGNSDVAATSGTTTLPERLLRGVLGAEALRSVGTKARTDLRARVSVLFDEETLRYVQVLDEAGIPDEAAAKRLYQATYNLEVAR
ncbi:dynamin family protein [Sphaerisporangium sp. B11E5]|uniref:dynamin family protein n=1 Tax=Sphaerisporangium sp. B11E5 TaxID=3153563 RepID=UPI00325F6ABE